MLHLVKTGRTCRPTAKGKKKNLGPGPATHTGDNNTNITTAQLKETRLELKQLKPAKVTLDGNRSLTVKEAIRALAPTLERMKKRGFDTPEIAKELHEKGIEITPPTLAKSLTESGRRKDKKAAAPPPPVQREKAAPAPQPGKPARVGSGQFVVTPDTPLDEL